jgi:carboxyl-terminal processing protease
MVQKIIPLPNSTGINLTIAKYLTPKGKDINKHGINPDVVLPLKAIDVKQKQDTQLESAKNLMAKMIDEK